MWRNFTLVNWNYWQLVGKNREVQEPSKILKMRHFYNNNKYNIIINLCKRANAMKKSLQALNDLQNMFLLLFF